MQKWNAIHRRQLSKRHMYVRLRGMWRGQSMPSCCCSGIKVKCFDNYINATSTNSWATNQGHELVGGRGQMSWPMYDKI